MRVFYGAKCTNTSVRVRDLRPQALEDRNMRRIKVLQWFLALGGLATAGCGETYHEGTYYPPPRERVVYHDPYYGEPAPSPAEPYSSDRYGGDSSRETYRDSYSPGAYP